MVLEKNPTQPFLQVEFLKTGIDKKTKKKYILTKVSFVAFNDGMPVIKVQDMKFDVGTMFDFHLPTEAYLALARTTLVNKVPIPAKRKK